MHAGIEGPHSDWSPLWCPQPQKRPCPVGLRARGDRLNMALRQGSVERAGIFPFLPNFLVIHPT
ncbi:MAG: hypothetical protein C7B43_20125 [Sulfobacillus benefaciens]|uniref:Uncharacterized protein n=1 Tax=Sulfobacillus benefaciens TaxID=453960 RepID=A0A2T2WM50_9FIRM|nr:MAG: hypothetical protein C7B43_20125 [Sulfobacillus benefaciens]